VKRRIALSGEIDLAVQDELRRRVAEVLDDDVSTVVFDLSEVTFFDSTGVGMIAQLLSSGLEVAIEKPAEPVRRVLAIVGLSDLIVEDA